MLLAGVVTGGLLALGTQVYRVRQPQNSLAATLCPSVGKRAARERLRPHSVTSQDIAFGGLATGGTLLLLASASGVTSLALVNGLVTILRTSRYGPLLYIVADTVRPLTFFPDSLMTVASGVLFGPFWGSLYSSLGASTSATTAYLVGKNLSKNEVSEQKREHLIKRYGRSMRQKPFESMVLMHSLFLPFDVVNGLAGYLRLGWKPFLLGTVLGSFPGTVACALFGASIKSATIWRVPRLNPLTLAASGVMLMGSLGIAYMLRKREVNKSDAPLGDQP